MSSNPHLKLVAGLPGEAAGPSDDYLMGLSAQGRESAFNQLVLRHERAVRTLCVVLLRDEAQARDVAQEVFLKVWEKRAAYQPSGKFKVWLLTLARNQCRSLGRRRRLLSFLGLDDAPEAATATLHPLDAAVEAETSALVLQSLHQLPEKFRVPLSLRFIDGLDYDAIAQVIGRTASAARSRVHYGLKHLEAHLPQEVLQ